MFGIKNHVNNLQYSERFYYSNYEFYNDYDKAEHHQKDISKVFYNCHRKIIPQIITYNDRLAQKKQNRIIKNIPLQTNKQLTMQQFISIFLNIFIQNNFTNYPDNVLSNNKYMFTICQFPNQFHLKYHNKNLTTPLPNLPPSPSSQQPMRYFLTQQQQLLACITELIKNNKNQQNNQYHYHILAFSQLAKIQVEIQCNMKEWEDGWEIGNLNLFVRLVKQVLGRVMEGVTCAYEVLCVPKIPVFSFFFNPCICAIKAFIDQCKSEKKVNSSSLNFTPKIAFINLDGFQSPVNLQYIKSIPSSSILYISIYREITTNLQCYQQISLSYSRFLAELVNECNSCQQNSKNIKLENKYTYFPKIIVFPLNSVYVKNQFMNKMNGEVVELMGSQLQITFLFENCIYQELRTFNPNIIFISYSGNLQIQQSHFNEIIRNLTVLSDHKIILFTNLSNLFAGQNILSQRTQQILKSSRSNPNLPSKILPQIQCQQQVLVQISQFLQEYLNMNINQMKLNQFFNNLCMFNKITSGTYSFQQSREVKPSEKYGVCQKYRYLNTLSKMNQYSYMRKYCSRTVNVESFSRLLAMERDAFLDMNREEVNFYSSFIDEAIYKIKNQQNCLPPKLKYRLEMVKQHLKKNGKNIDGYCLQKKKEIVVCSISRQKIKKWFTLLTKPSVTTINLSNVVPLQFYMSSPKQKDKKQQIYLQNFTQIITDSECNIIFCLNYLDEMFGLEHIFGFVQVGKNIVQMKKLGGVTGGNLKIYLEYSTHFNLEDKLLYLYWPYEWDLIQEAACLLLGVKYQPKLVHQLKVIKFDILAKSAQMYDIKYVANGQLVKPRYGSTMWSVNSQKHYIFGGYYDDFNDFTSISCGVSLLQISQKYQFSICDVVKEKLGVRLRPKANYQIHKLNEEQICIQGGFGREFTNYYNIYSYNRYIFNLKTLKLAQQKTQRHINTLKQPMQSTRVGRFETIKFDEKRIQYKKSLDEKNKYRFILYGKDVTNIISFISDQHTIRTVEKEQRNVGLFEMNRRIKNIFTHSYNTGELYLTKKENNKIVRVEILVRVVNEKKDWVVSEFLLPNEDSMVSMCIGGCGQSVFVVARSPVYTNQKYVVYSGNLSMIEEILETKQIILNKYYEFSTDVRNISHKTIFCMDEKIIIVGGKVSENGIRQDYFVQKFRGIVRSQLVRLACKENHQMLDMVNCYVVPLPVQQDTVILYAVSLFSQSKWYLKLQVYNTKSSSHSIFISPLTICTLIGKNVYEIKPDFQHPIFVSIQKYHLFVFETLKNQFSTLVTKLTQIAQQNKYYEIDRQLVSNKIGKYINDIEQNILKNVQIIYILIQQYNQNIINNINKYQDYPEIQNCINDLIISLLTIQVQKICLKFVKDADVKQLYKFYLQDKNKPFAKYIALGQLGTNNLVFFRLKFKKEVGMPIKNLNKNQNDIFGYNFLSNCLNSVLFNDEQSIKEYIINNNQIGLDINYIQPFITDVQEFFIYLEIVNQNLSN